jgi:hypothetical protein
MKPQPTGALSRAYRMTVYTVAGIAVRVGRPSRAMDRLLHDHRQPEAVFITAYNPFSRPMPPGWNCRMQSRLRQALHRRTVLPASGQWRRWSEAHLLVFDSRRRMIVLARHFQQHAIVTLRPGQPARLVHT